MPSFDAPGDAPSAETDPSVQRTSEDPPEDMEQDIGSTVSAMHIPGKIRGGKTAVRKEGARLIPEIVVRYDPPNIPDAQEAKGRFITYVKDRLVPQLEAFVKR